MQSPLVGSTLGQYQVLEELGRGGMGSVYRGLHPALNRVVAIKVLAPALVNERGFLERFHREAVLVAGLKHPHILTVYDFGQQGDVFYIVMEYVGAGTVKDRPAGPMNVEVAVRLVAQVADALNFAHASGIIHRDIKPANIMLERPDFAKLGDFGIARMSNDVEHLTRTGVGIGTPEYMSPEQGEGLRDLDGRSDIYSLGIVLFDLLTGRVPYRSTSAFEVIRQHIEQPLPIIDLMHAGVSPALVQVISMATAKSPAGRFQTAEDMRVALEAALQAGAQSQGIPSTVVMPERTGESTPRPGMPPMYGTTVNPAQPAPYGTTVNPPQPAPYGNPFNPSQPAPYGTTVNPPQPAPYGAPFNPGQPPPYGTSVVPGGYSPPPPVWPGQNAGVPVPPYPGYPPAQTSVVPPPSYAPVGPEPSRPVAQAKSGKGGGILLAALGAIVGIACAGGAVIAYALQPQNAGLGAGLGLVAFTSTPTPTVTPTATTTSTPTPPPTATPAPSATQVPTSAPEPTQPPPTDTPRPSQPTGGGGGGGAPPTATAQKPEGGGIIEIRNNYPDAIRCSYSGPESKSVTVPGSSVQRITTPPGQYSEVCTATSGTEIARGSITVPADTPLIRVANPPATTGGNGNIVVQNKRREAISCTYTGGGLNKRLDVPAGQSRSTEVPAGTYQEKCTTDLGIIISQGSVTVPVDVDVVRVAS